MRRQLGLSQQDLSALMRTTVRSVARWETAAFPQGRILKRLQEFATKQGLTEHADVFHRLLRQEQFLKANRKFFLTVEGLDLQVAIAKARQSRKDPGVANCWAKTLSYLASAVSRVFDLPKENNSELWEVDELMQLEERLHQYAEQAQKEAQELQKKAEAPKQDRKQTRTPKKRKPA
jgi:hypothetical protein